MKIKLIYSPRVHSINYSTSNNHPHVPPLGMPIVSGILRKSGFHVSQDDLDIKVHKTNLKKGGYENLIDLNVFDDSNPMNTYLNEELSESVLEETEKILKLTDVNGYDIYGFSIVDETDFTACATTLALARLLKERTDATIIVGGFTFSRYVHELDIVTSPYIDYIILSGGVGFKDFLNEFSSRKSKKIQQMDYVVTESNLMNVKGNLDAIKARFRSIFEDHCSVPDFKGLPIQLYKYKLPDQHTNLGADKEILILPIKFIHGCPNKCIFCPSSQHNQQVQHLGVEEIIETLSNINKQYNCMHFMFLHDNININKEFIHSFCNSLINSNLTIKWADCATFNSMDEKILRMIKESGAIKLIFGIESASPKLMKFIKKPFTLDHSIDILKKSSEIGLWNELELIAGLPYENSDDIANTIDFISNYKKYIDYFYLNKFLLMDSELYHQPFKYGLTEIHNNKFGADFPRKFNEMNGLNWPEKETQIRNSYNLIRDNISETNKYGYNLPLLFYLSDIFPDKSTIKQYFSLINSDDSERC